MARRRSAHLMRMVIEGISSYSPYRGAKISYVRDYERDPTPITNVDLVSKMDVTWAIKTLQERGELSLQEIQMLDYVMMDGRLSRRNISELIEKDLGYHVDQRTVSRRLEAAYWKISKFLGFEYGDARVFKMIAKRMGRPSPYILSDDEIDKIQIIWERI